MTVPYIGFGNSTLKNLPQVKSGDEVHCPHCNQRHMLESSLCDGKPSEMLLFYKCGDKTFLGALNGRLVAHANSDCSGEI